MSYCRNNGHDSDVYVISNINEKGVASWECVECCMESLRKGRAYSSRKEMLTHLLEHIRLGDKVPERALRRLRQEIDAG